MKAGLHQGSEWRSRGQRGRGKTWVILRTRPNEVHLTRGETLRIIAMDYFLKRYEHVEKQSVETSVVPEGMPEPELHHIYKALDGVDPSYLKGRRLHVIEVYPTWVGVQVLVRGHQIEYEQIKKANWYVEKA